MPMETDIKKENEKKKQYLLQYRDALRAEKQIEEEITQLRLDTMMPAVVNDGMPHGSGGCGDLSGYAAAMDRLMDDLKGQLEKRIAIRREITERIETMQNETEKLVLKLRYIHLSKWTEIADRMCISERHAKRLHGNALIHFKIIRGQYER
jgi:DNA-directed RNA polymerase specialized sigma subunit